jgi:hypothetical protein
VTEKQRRLRDLARHSDRTPVTCWGYDEFNALRPGPATRWWVRSLAEHATVRYRHAQGPWVPEDVDAFFGSLEKTARAQAFAIQEYIEPVVAGATLCTDDGLLTEGVGGAAAVLLRGGGVGDMVASHGDELSWRLDRGASPHRSALEQAHNSIPAKAGALWEWIVDDVGEVFHVDRKELRVPLLNAVPTGGLPVRWELGRPPHGPSLELPDTSIGGLSALATVGTVHICRGSPLAHLCYEAVTRGHAVVLEIPDRA